MLGFIVSMEPRSRFPHGLWRLSVKTKYNIGDLVWVFYSHWPKERDMAIMIDKRTGTKSLQPEYQVNFIHKPLYMLWYAEASVEKMEAQPRLKTFFTFFLDKLILLCYTTYYNDEYRR